MSDRPSSDSLPSCGAPASSAPGDGTPFGLPVAALSEPEAVRLRAAVGRIGKGLRSSQANGVLSPSALDALGTLVRRGPMRPSDLAAFDGLNPTMLSRLALKLEEQGFIHRVADPGDRRSVSLAATAAGVARHEQLLAARVEALARALATLGEPHHAALRAALPALEALAGVLRGVPAPETATTGQRGSDPDPAAPRPRPAAPSAQAQA